MMLIIEYVNVLTRGPRQNKLAITRRMQYLVAVLLGATPGCLGAFSVVAMYSHGVLSLGATVATVPEHFLQEHLWQHVALGHVPRVFLWTLAALAVTQLVNIQLNLSDVISHNTLAMILIARLVGIIPESGPICCAIGQLDCTRWPWHAALARPLTKAIHAGQGN